MTIPRKDRTAKLKHECDYFKRGHRAIVGIDEAGRGAWAGPVFAGAVCLPLEPGDNAALMETLRGVRDSKDTTRLQREALATVIQDTAFAWGVGCAMHSEIDTLGIVPATKLAMERALDEMMHSNKPGFEPDCLFLDSMAWDEAPVDCEQLHIKKGDKYSLSIAAASILAKYWRDDHMRQIDKKFPQYGFARHKGYGTKQHRQALKQHGVSEIHRTYYRPVKAHLD